MKVLHNSYHVEVISRVGPNVTHKQVCGENTAAGFCSNLQIKLFVQSLGHFSGGLHRTAVGQTWLESSKQIFYPGPYYYSDRHQGRPCR